MSATSTPISNLMQIRPRRDSGRIGEYNKNFYTLLGTNLQARPMGRFSGLTIQTARTRVMYFWGFVDIAVHLRSQIPQTPNFGSE